MPDPHHVLGLAPDATPQQARSRYLELVRTYSPERYPRRFAEIQAAYEQLRDPADRIDRMLFKPDVARSIDELIQDAGRRLTRERIATGLLLRLDERSR